MLVSLDSQKRVSLGKLIKGMATKLFEAEIKDGQIILKPVKIVPENESWLYKNSKALSSVKKGLKDATEGKMTEFDPDRE